MINKTLNYFKRIKIPSKQEIEDFYPTYLKAHKHPVNKLMHIFGNLLTLFYVYFIVLLSFFSLLFLPLFLFTPFVVYVGAWPGHKYFEKNKPATYYTNPLLTKFCDWKMMKDLFFGNLKLDSRE